MQGPSATFIYLAVVFGLLVIPRALQRFRLPAPLTCFAFGIIVAGFFPPLIHDSVISYLSTLGVAEIFLSVFFPPLFLDRLFSYLSTRGFAALFLFVGRKFLLPKQQKKKAPRSP